jgi:uncharacterized glyoxalase superfamily protein PhnB
MALKFEVFGLIVKDMPSALAFYRELGLEIPMEMDAEGHVDYMIADKLRMSWDTYEIIQSFNSDWQAPHDDHHRFALAFRCESATEVNEQYQRLVDKGYRSHTAPFDAFWGQRYAQILDPDGNVVDLFANL